MKKQTQIEARVNMERWGRCVSVCVLNALGWSRLRENCMRTLSRLRDGSGVL